MENPFGTVEDHVIKGGEWSDFDAFCEELQAFETQWEGRIHATTQETPLARFERERFELLPLPPKAAPFDPDAFRTVSNDCLISYGNVRYWVPPALVGQRVRIRVRQGRFLEAISPSGEPLVRHLLQPKGTPPVIPAGAYDGLRPPATRKIETLLAEFRSRYGERSAQVEPFLSGLLARHPSHPAQAVGKALDLLSAVPIELAAAVVGEAVTMGFPTPGFVEELLRRRTRATSGMPPIAPPLEIPPVSHRALGVQPESGSEAAARETHGAPEAGSAGEAPRLPERSWPSLDIDRPLAAYSRALPEEEPTPLTFVR